MEIKDIAHRWPPNIQSYEQKFLGVPMTKFIGSAMGGLVMLVIVSQSFPGVGGIIGGAMMGAIVFGLIILMTTKFPAFYHMTIPGYWFRRSFQPASEKVVELPLILATNRKEKVLMEDWDGQATGEIE